jgi:predicted ester cyclase
MTSPEDHDPRIEANKVTLRRMYECLNEGDIDGFLEGLAPHWVRHCQAMPPELQEMRGPGVMREWLLSNQASFPDYREEIDWLVGEGDYIAWRSRGTGTHRGTMGSFPSTNRRMDLAIIGMHRFEDGKIVETWTSWDNVAVLTQLGLLPPAGAESGEVME